MDKGLFLSISEVSNSGKFLVFEDDKALGGNLFRRLTFSRNGLYQSIYILLDWVEQ